MFYRLQGKDNEMVKIIAHRGFWLTPDEKNTETAFKRALELGFGIETDVRDFCGNLVISHDICKESCKSLSSFLNNYKNNCNNDAEFPYLALNIKADGLQISLKEEIIKHDIHNYFVFDMSIPDTLAYLELNTPVFTRRSEYENHTELARHRHTAGIWLDQFKSDWYTRESVMKILECNLKICVVSPELHNRDYRYCWSLIKSISEQSPDHTLMLCTDFPNKAKEFFNNE